MPAQLKKRLRDDFVWNEHKARIEDLNNIHHRAQPQHKNWLFVLFCMCMCAPPSSHCTIRYIIYVSVCRRLVIFYKVMHFNFDLIYACVCWLSPLAHIQVFRHKYHILHIIHTKDFASDTFDIMSLLYIRVSVCLLYLYLYLLYSIAKKRDFINVLRAAAQHKSLHHIDAARGASELALHEESFF